MKRPNLILLSAATLALSACATSSKTFGPDGQEAYSIGCSGGALSWGACYEKAGELCGAKGYNILSRNGEGGFAAGGGNGSFFAGTTSSRSMVISCKS
ncbi:hypothetical protein D3C72_1599390 [compost metagenome]